MKECDLLGDLVTDPGGQSGYDLSYMISGVKIAQSLGSTPLRLARGRK